jgi:hypothetical protein
MDTRKKFWLVLSGAIAGLLIIACSCSSLLPSATPTTAPLVTVPPASVATLAPVPANNQEPMPGLTGKWIDPDSTGGGTISTIAYQNGEYVVTSVINTGRGPNEVTKTSWAGGVLTWEYCPSGMHCITQNTVSVDGDSLTVNWAWSDGGNSGTSVLQRQP